ncbi:MAG: CARDB domain-containing protein [Planctomycetaceae bacterium]
MLLTHWLAAFSRHVRNGSVLANRFRGRRNRKSSGGAGGSGQIEHLEDRVLLTFEGLEPLGSLAYQDSVSADFAAVNETDQFTFDLDADQVLSAALFPSSGTLQSRIEIFDPSNASLGVFDAPAVGEPAFLQTVSVSSSGTYRIEVTSLAGTGNYDLDVLLNSAGEEEGFTGVSNNTIATGQDIDGSSISLAGTASRLAVNGEIDSADADFFSFTLTAGESTDLVLASDGGTAAVALFDSSGVQLAAGIAGATNANESITGFIAPSTGTYFARVDSAAAFENYGLVVTRGISFDLEPNNAAADAQDINGTFGVVGELGGSAGAGGGGEVFTDSQTQTNVYTPNTLTYTFSGLPNAGGDATLTIDANADLDLTSEFLAFNAEGLLAQNLFVNGGLQMVPVQTQLTIPLETLSQLLSDNAITFTFTPSSSVNNLGGSPYLTVTLEYPLGDDHYSFEAVAGDTLTLSTTTPGGGAGEPVNLLDPSVRLFFEDGINPPVEVAFDDNSGGDGRNSLINYTVPASEGGTYRAVVQGTGSGDYTLSVVGATAAAVPTLDGMAVAPADGDSVPVYPATVRFDFSEPLLFSTLTASDLQVTDPLGTISPAAGVSIIDGDTIEFDLSTLNVGDGTYSLSIAGGALSSIEGAANLPISATFQFDTVAPTVASVTANGTALPGGSPIETGANTFVITFSEPMADSDIGPEDVALNNLSFGTGFIPSSGVLDPSGITLTLTYDDLPEGLYDFSIRSAADGARDRAGNLLDGDSDGTAGGDFVLSFAADFGSDTPFPTPLEAKLPLGSLIYDPPVTGFFDAVGDVDNFTIDVDPGQTITVVLTPDDLSIQASVDLIAPGGGSVATSSAAAAGEGVLIQTFTPTVAGTYTVRATGLAGAGIYDVDVFLNAHVELEAATEGTVPNDTLAQAENIDASAVAVSGTADRLAVVGISDSVAGPDVYSFTAAAGVPVTIVMASETFDGIATLTDASGNILTYSVAGAENVTGSIVDFVSPTGGTYFVHLTGITPDARYSLVVTRGATFGIEQVSGDAQPIGGSGQVLGYAGIGEIDVPAGTGITLPLGTALVDGSGAQWDIQGSGYVLDGSNNAFDGAFNSSPFGFGNPASTEDGGREIVIGPQFSGNIEAHRKIYVSDTEGFTRFLEIFTNTGTFPVNQFIQIFTNLGSDADTRVVSTSSGDTLFDTDDDWIVTDDNVANGGDSAVAHVISAPGGVRPDFAFRSGADGIAYEWNLQLQPGETQIIMHFGVQDPDSAIAASTAAGLANLQGDALTGMTPDEIAAAVNFAGASTASVDRYTIDVTSATTLTLSTTTPGDGPGEFRNDMNPSIELFDPSGTSIGFDDNSGVDGRNAALTVSVSTPGRYEIVVRASGSAAGEYGLAVDSSIPGAVAGIPFEATAVDPLDGEAFAALPSRLTLDFSQAPLLATLQLTDIVITQPGGSTVNPAGLLVIDGDTVDFDLTGLDIGEGAYVIDIAPGTVDSISGEPLAAFSTTIFVDATPPTVAEVRANSSVIVDGDVIDVGALTLEIDFSEPVLNSFPSVFEAPLYDAVTGITFLPTSISVDPGGTTLSATYDAPGLPEGDLTLTLDSFAFRDLVGNPLDGGTDFTFRFFTDIVSEALPVPLVPRNPRGSLVFGQDVSGAFHPLSDVDEWTVDLDPDQTLSAALWVSDPSVVSEITLLDSTGTPVATSAALAAGEAVFLQNIAVASAGIYTLQVSNSAGNGGYRLRTLLNSQIEEEPFALLNSNDDIASAILIDASTVSLPGAGTADRLAVTGRFGPEPAEIVSPPNNPGEPNDTFAEAVPTGIVGSFSSFFLSANIGDNLNISAGLDVDIYEVTLFPGDTLLIDIDAQVLGSGIDSYIRLFDAFGNELDSNDDDPAGGTLDSYLEYSFFGEVPETFYIGVSDLSNTGYNPNVEGSGSPGSTGIYDIYIEAFGSVAALAAVGGAVESDVYSFSVNPNEPTSLVVSSDTAIATLELLDSAGNVIAVGASDPTNADQAIPDFVSLTGGTFYARVTGSEPDAYSLVVTRGAAFDLEANNETFEAQDISAANRVLGALSGGAGGELFSVSETQNTVFWPNTLDYTFNNLPSPGGDAILTIDVNADLDATSEFLSFNAEGLLAQDLFVVGGLQDSPVQLQLTIPLATLTELLSDSSATFTFVPSSAVDNLSGNPTLTLTLEYPLGDDYYSFEAVAGDTLFLETFTPGDGSGEPANNLDPQIELFFDDGINLPVSLATDDNSAADGRNALLSYTATETGRYIVLIEGVTGSGSYVLNVSGATGAPAAMQATAVTPVDGTVVTSTPATATLDFSKVVLLSSLTASDVTIQIPGGGTYTPAGVTVIDGNTFEFDLTGLSGPDGTYVIQIAAGDVLDAAGNGNAPFSSTFLLDATNPSVTGISVNGTPLAPNDVIASGSTVVEITFNEELSTLNLGPEDVLLDDTLSGASLVPVSFVYDAVTSVLTLDYGDLPEGEYTLTLIEGADAFRDVVDNPLAPFSIDFTADNVLAALATPFVPLVPLGSLVYQSADTSGVFHAVNDEDTFSVDLQGGQTLSVSLSVTDPDLVATVELLDATDAVIGSATAAAAGEAVFLQDVAIPSDGTYRIRNTATTLNSVATYSFTAVLNAHIDAEPNDTAGQAQNINGSAILFAAPGRDRMAVAGTGGADDDFFSFSLASGETASLFLSAEDAGLELELFDPSGNPLTLGTVGELDSSIFRSVIDGYTASPPGNYQARVRAGAGIAYTLVVTRNAQFELEPNNVVADAQPLLQIGGPGTFTASVLGARETSALLIDPDDFPPGTDLTNAFAGATLTIVGSNGVTPTGAIARTQTSSLASTGSRVFAQDTNTFFNSSSSFLRVDFDNPTRSVSIDVIGDDSIDPGILRAYAADGTLLEEVHGFNTTAGNPQTLTITRPDADISYILASGLGGDTANLDNLVTSGDLADIYQIQLADGDVLEAVTSTPGDGTGEFHNSFDPFLRLVNAAGLVVAQDDNSLPDGRNARFVYTVPAGAGGNFTLQLDGIGVGEYSITAIRTGDPLPDEAPSVVSTSPADAASVGSAPAFLDVTFSEALLANSLDVTDLVFANGSVTVDSVQLLAGNTVRFSITVPNTEDTYDYTISAGSVSDLQGTGNTEFAGSFVVDQTGPRVVSTTPGIQASAPFSQLTFVFNEGIDPASVSTADVLSFNGPGGNLLSSVTGVSVSGSELTVTFNGQSTAGVYVMVIGPNITDLAGNLMDQNNNGTGGEAGDTFSRQLTLQSPNLDVLNTIAAPAAAEFGDVIDFTYTVRNIGSDPALEHWVDRIFLSTDSVLDASDTVLATIPQNGGTLGPLDAINGANDSYTRTESLTLPLNVASVAGGYFLLVKTDVNNQQPESNEGDNVGSHAINLTLPPLPDLVVSDITAPVEALSGQQIPISWTISNQGTSDFSGTFSDDIFLSTDEFLGGDQFFGRFEFTGDIPAGGSVTRTQTITLPATIEGDYFVIIRTDEFGQVFEGQAGESNNITSDDAAIAIELQPFPNLQVASVTTPPTAFSGQQTVIQWVVENTGTGSTNSPSWSDAIYLSTDAFYDASDLFLGTAVNPSFLVPGDSYLNSRLVTLPEGIDDSYYFIVRTDIYGQVFEFENEGDNITAGGPTDVMLTPPPDLQVTNVNAPGTVFSGQPINLTWTVENLGSGSTRSGSWSDRIYMSTDTTLDASDQLLGTTGHSGVLAALDGYTANSTVTLPVGVSGDFYFIVQTDAFNQVFEHVFEANNTGFDATPTTVSLTPPPDLVVTDIVAPATALAGHTISVDYTVENLGSTLTPNSSWQDRIFLSTDDIFDAATDTQIASRTHFGALDIGEGYTESFIATLPNGLNNDFYVFIATDFTDLVFELDNANNILSAATPMTVELRPADLVVVSVVDPAAAGGPSTAEAGGSLLLQWEVQNQGTGITTQSNWVDRVYLSSNVTFGDGDDLQLSQLTHSGALDVLETYTVSGHTLQIPASVPGGSYRVFVKTDAANAVFESQEGNNVLGLPVEITRTTADLRPTAVTAPATADSGQAITVGWTVENFGAARTNSTYWHDEVFLSADQTISGDDVSLGSVFHSNALDGGQQYTASRTFTLPIDLSGDLYVIVRTDTNNVVIEDLQEGNNDLAATAVTAISLSPVADLAVTDVDAPPVAFSGQPITLNWTVENIGGGAANGTWYDAVYLSLDQIFDRTTDTYIGFANRPAALAAGEQYTQTATLNIPNGLSGPYYVFVAADSNQRIYERGAEANNVGQDPLAMEVSLTPPADLVAGLLTLPSDAVPGKDVTVSYTVENQGTNAANGTWTDSLYISADDHWDVTDPLLGRVVVTANVTSGNSYTRDLTAPLPGVVPGDYHVIIRSDILNNIPESDETNNLSASLNTTAVDFEELTLGTASSGSLGTGQSVYYKVDVPAGETLSVLFDSAATDGFSELYVAFDRVPTRSDFDFGGIEPFQPDQRAILPASESGTYFIMVYGNSASGAPAFDITAELLAFDVFTTDFGRGGNSGNRTIEIHGARFDQNTTVSLTNGAGITVPAETHYYISSLQMYATFNLAGLPAGQYDVVVEKDASTSVTVPDSLQVVDQLPSAPIRPTIDAPSRVRRGAAYSFDVRWGNDSINDITVPLLTVGNTAPFGSAPGDTSYGTRFTFIASRPEGPQGILIPGDAFSRTFYTSSDSFTQSYTAFVDRVGKDSAEAFDWAAIEAELRPQDIPDAEWDAIFQQLILQTGTTWGEVLPVAVRNADRIVLPGNASVTVSQLLQPEVTAVWASLSNSISGTVHLDAIRSLSEPWRILAVQVGTDVGFAAVGYEDGTFSLPGLEDGDYQLTVQLGQFTQSFPTTYTLAGGSTVIQDVELAPSAPVDVVLDIAASDGGPVTDADILLYRNGILLSRGILDADDRVTFENLPEGTYVVVAELAGYGRVVADLDTSEPLATRLSAILFAPGTDVRGTVVSDAGASLDFTIAAIANDGRNLPPVAATVDAGTYLFPSLAAGNYDLVVLAEGYSPLVVAAVDVPASGELVLDDIILTLPGQQTPSLQAAGDEAAAGAIPDWFIETVERLTNLYIAFRGPGFVPDIGTCWDKYQAARSQGFFTGMGLFTLWFQQRYATLIMVSGVSGGDPISLALYMRYFDALGPVGTQGFGLNNGMKAELELQARSGWDSAMQAAVTAIQSDPDWMREFDCDEAHTRTYTVQQLYNLPAGNVSDYVSVGSGLYSGDRGNNSKWRFVFVGPIGVLAGGVGSWGTSAGSNLPEIADFRRLSGSVTAELSADDATVKVTADWQFTVSDAVDFEPGNALGPLLYGLKVLERNGMTWDVPFEFTTPIEVDPGTFGVRRDPECDPCNSDDPPDDCDDTDAPVSRDPNDILGPDGFGPEQWIPASQPIEYTIRFENDAALATAPAQVVRITQTLDSDLDPRTYRVGDFGLGDLFVDVPANRAFYTDRIDLTAEHGVFVDVVAGIDVATGEAFWEFTSIDPATGDIPADPLLGFLPPNETSPEGEGFARYSVKPRSSAVTGDVIDAEARIVFDINEPIDTPPIFHTLDADLPVSSVTALPASSVEPVFDVSWTGTDPGSGSGLAGYSIFVSVNGGPFEVWLENTTLTEASYTGEPGKTYDFFSVAYDNAGNSEPAPAVADAVTAVIGGAVLTVTIDPTTISENGGTAIGTVTRTGNTDAELIVTLVSDNETEAIVTNTVTIGVGADSATFTVTGVPDNIVDATQTVTITASAVDFDDVTATVDVTNVDVATLTVQLDAASVSETAGTVSGTVSRNTGTTGDLVVNLLSGDVSEVTVPGPGTVTIPDGQASVPFVLTVVNDGLIDGTQTVDITASAATFVDGTDSVDVTDVQSGTVSITSRRNGAESGPRDGWFVISLSAEAEQDVIVNYTITGTATADGDYVALPGSITIPAGELSAQVDVVTINDDIAEGGADTVRLTLDSASTAGTVTVNPAAASRQIFLIDNDRALIRTSRRAATVRETGTSRTFDVTLRSEPVGTVVLTVTSTDPGEAVADVTQLTFDSTNWNVPQTVTITGVDDAESDGAQVSEIQVTVDTGATTAAEYLATPAAIVTVTTLDDEPPAPTATVQSVTFFNEDADEERNFSPEQNGQRSIIRGVSVVIDQEIDVTDASAFSLVNTTLGSSVGLQLVSATKADGRTTVVLAFLPAPRLSRTTS